MKGMRRIRGLIVGGVRCPLLPKHIAIYFFLLFFSVFLAVLNFLDHQRKVALGDPLTFFSSSTQLAQAEIFLLDNALMSLPALVAREGIEGRRRGSLWWLMEACSPCCSKASQHYITTKPLEKTIADCQYPADITIKYTCCCRHSVIS